MVGGGQQAPSSKARRQLLPGYLDFLPQKSSEDPPVRLQTGMEEQRLKVSGPAL